MPIIGINYTRINAEKTKGLSKDMTINTSPSITAVKKSKLQGLKDDVDVLSIEFTLKSDISPGIGKIEIEGTIIYNTGKADEIIKMWTEKKSVPAAVQVEILNHIFKKTGILALELSDTLQLPPVINMPSVKLTDTAKN